MTANGWIFSDLFAASESTLPSATSRQHVRLDPALHKHAHAPRRLRPSRIVTVAVSVVRMRCAVHFEPASSSRLQLPVQDCALVEHAQQTLFQLRFLPSLTTASVHAPRATSFPTRAPLQSSPAAAPRGLSLS